MRRLRLALAACGAVAAMLGGIVALDRAFPPDLRRLDDTGRTVVDASGRLLTALPAAGGRWRLPVAAADVDPLYLSLLIAYEDRRFESHPGVDGLALLRALGDAAIGGRIVSGASTLTMQVARLLEPRPRTLGAKLIEMARAVQLERRFDKRRILGMYLTLAPYGGNLEGLRAASLAWLGKEPKSLSLAEAALLVALPQSPERRRPDLAPDAAREAAVRVLMRAAAVGAIPRPEAEAAARAELPLRRFAMPESADHLARREASARPGPVVRTTLDDRLQRRIEEMARELVRLQGDAPAVAAIVAEIDGRRLRAYVGGQGRDTPAGFVDLARGIRSPGSTLKPFIYALAFDDGLVRPDTKLDDLPQSFGSYAPLNFDREFQGTVTVRRALQHSLNVPAATVLERVGPARFAALLSWAGTPLHLARRELVPTVAVALGGAGTTLVDLVKLYGALADDGRVLPLAAADGERGGEGRRLVSAKSAREVTAILAEAPRPAGLAQGAVAGDGRRVAYKTGTSYGFRDSWAIGYSASHIVGVWVGHPDGAPRPGRGTAAPLMFALFDQIDGNRGLEPLREAEAPSVAAVPPAHRSQTARELGGKPLRILFPPDGATVDLRPGAAGYDALPLEAEGGSGLLAWHVDGVPVARVEAEAKGRWQPDARGFVRLSVTDERGRTAVSHVRLR
jgi:penicillin-binding protein 1C